MKPQNSRAWNRMFRFFLLAIVAGLLLPVGLLHATGSADELSWQLKQELLAPVSAWVANVVFFLVGVYLMMHAET